MKSASRWFHYTEEGKLMESGLFEYAAEERI
jgi:hypothetical protein